MTILELEQLCDQFAGRAGSAFNKGQDGLFWEIFIPPVVVNNNNFCKLIVKFSWQGQP